MIVLIACNLDFGHVINDQPADEEITGDGSATCDVKSFDFLLTSNIKKNSLSTDARLTNFRSIELIKSYNDATSESSEICDEQGNEIPLKSEMADNFPQSVDFMEFPVSGF